MLRRYAAIAACYFVCLWIGFHLSQGPWPISQRIAELAPAERGAQQSLIVWHEPGAAPEELQQAEKWLQDNGATHFVSTGTHPPRPGTNTLWLNEVQLEQRGISAEWDGQLRTVSLAANTLPGRIATAIGHPRAGLRVTLPSSSILPASIDMQQLRSLPAGSVEGQLVFFARKPDWETQRYQTRFGDLTYTEVLARTFTGSPPPAILHPSWIAGVLAVTGLFLLRCPMPSLIRNLLACWASFFVLSALIATSGTLMPAEGFVVGTLCLALFRRAAPTQTAAKPATDVAPYLDSVRTPRRTTQKELFAQLAEASVAYCGALAAWVATPEAGGWTEQARAGDAGPLDPELPTRLQAPLHKRRAQDRAFYSLPLPNPTAAIGVLVIQPSDHSPPDPWPSLASAMLQVFEQIEIETHQHPDSIQRVRGMRHRLTAYSAALNIHCDQALFDSLGLPLRAADDFFQSLPAEVGPDSLASEVWLSLGGKLQDFPQASHDKEGVACEFQGRTYVLRAGMHRSKVECYTILAKKTGQQTEESPC